MGSNKKIGFNFNPHLMAGAFFGVVFLHIVGIFCIIFVSETGELLSNDATLILFLLFPLNVLIPVPFYLVQVAIAAMTYAGVFYAVNKIYRYYRPILPADACRGCRYNLTGNESGVCPECGLVIAHRIEQEVAS